MFRLFVIALLFGLIFWLARGFGREGGRETVANGQIQELVRDALTGVYFPKGEAVSITRGGETLYFSTLENRDRFLSLHRAP